MDLRTVVAASMLPASRSAIAAAFRAVHSEPLAGAPFLELLWAAAGRRDPVSAAIVADVLQRADGALEASAQLGIEPLSLVDRRYPALLACTFDPPPVLWVRGDPAILVRPVVAVVGSRAATPYARQVAERLAAELAGRGVVVASGLARGVDSAAHRGCLGAGGPTVAVLGCGLDTAYPPEHRDLADSIARQGVVMAELAVGAPPLPEHFPLRNRIISGISLATVVVEASERSGSLITARYALEQGRDVMAVPGSVLSGRNRGSHALLKDGAKVVETADDILQGLGWSSAIPAVENCQPPTTDPLLAEMRPGDAYGLDDLAAATGLPGAQLLARLTELELAGTVAIQGGRFVRRTDLDRE